MELEELRKQIDAIDDDIVDLYKQRMMLSGQIAEHKKDSGLGVMNAGREREVISRVARRAGEGMENYAKVLYQTIFETSRSYQNAMLTESGDFAQKIQKTVRFLIFLSYQLKNRKQIYLLIMLTLLHFS